MFMESFRYIQEQGRQSLHTTPGLLDVDIRDINVGGDPFRKAVAPSL